MGEVNFLALIRARVRAIETPIVAARAGAEKWLLA
jgi:hypothetical protein